MSACPQVTVENEAKLTELFERLCQDISTQGFSIQFNALPPALVEALWLHVQQMAVTDFASAGIGRQADHQLNGFVRKDEICWIDGNTAVGKNWLGWSRELQQYLNRRLFLGLFSFESHFAHYAPGAFYKKHVDAFRGESNRVLSLVLYLNPGWLPDDGGELLIYAEDGEDVLARVVPGCGTLVAFLSEQFPHEVLPSRRDRYSIAGWFRLNSSTADRVDPPT